MTKQLSLSAATDICNSYRKAGKKVVFTNGCFDILHAGHVTYLADAKSEGDILILGLNSDASIQRLKGPKRPIVPEADRVIVMSALQMIDHIVVFEDDTPEHTIATLKPDIHVKGGDYTVADLPESKIVQAYGGKVVIKSFLNNHSTSDIIQTIKERYA